MQPKLIGLCGAIGAGKSTVARVLMMHGYQIVPLAGPLKSMLKAVGLTEDDVNGHLKESPHPLLCGKTPRKAMQLLGTEWGRQRIGDDLWIRLWAAQREKHRFVVVDDVRFPNEFEAIKERGGTLIRVLRPGMAYDMSVHDSELHWLTAACDHEIYNTGPISELHALVKDILTERAVSA